jgi:hypothetical protein
MNNDNEVMSWAGERAFSDSEEHSSSQNMKKVKIFFGESH